MALGSVTVAITLTLPPHLGQTLMAAALRAVPYGRQVAARGGRGQSVAAGRLDCERNGVAAGIAPSPARHQNAERPESGTCDGDQEVAIHPQPRPRRREPDRSVGRRAAQLLHSLGQSMLICHATPTILTKLKDSENAKNRHS